jgi:hypothetical protein
VSSPRTNVRARLRDAAQRMSSPEEDPRPSSTPPAGYLLETEPSMVFAATLRSLRTRALSAEKWSDSELADFEDRLAVLVAGIRARGQGAAGHSYEKGDTACRDRCEDLLKRCQQPDPETGQPHLDCFMIYADCLFRCGNETY